MHREDLLRRELQDGAPTALYSSHSMFLVAFFGGPLASLVYSSLNLFKLRREHDEAPWIVAASALALLPFGLLLPGLDPGILSLFSKGDPTRGFRYVSRIFALLVFLLLHWRQKRHLHALACGMGATRSPWKAAILVLVAGAMAQGVLATGILSLGRALP